MIKTRELCNLLIDYFTNDDVRCDAKDDILEWAYLTIEKMDAHNAKYVSQPREKKERDPAPSIAIIRAALTTEYQTFADLCEHSGCNPSAVRGYLSNYKDEYDTTTTLGKDGKGRAAVVKLYKAKG